jgi:flagellar hook protein FlgE
LSFYTALSGLKASQTELGAISNNIANVGTAGFKRGETEFADLVSSSAMQSSGRPGLGIRLRGISQQFTQGGLEASERSLDLAISGQGFFMTRTPGSGASVAYTRNGAFSVDADRYIVDDTGARLQVLPTDSSGNITATGFAATRPAQLPLTSGTAQATRTIDLGVTFPSAADLPPNRTAYGSSNPYRFDRDDVNSYNFSTNTTIFDGSGNPLPMTTYYIRDNIPSGSTSTTSWTAHSFIGDTEVSYDNSAAVQPAALTLTFDAGGAMTTPTGSLPIGPVNVAGASAPLTFDLTYRASTKQASAPFTLTSFDQDGFAAGALQNVSVGADGLISATFSDGQTLALGKIVIATFPNSDGLRQIGDSKWAASGTSGNPIVGEANANGNGQVQSGAIEQANVDITEELVALIQAQRNFSANAKAIEAANQMTQTIVSLRG